MALTPRSTKASVDPISMEKVPQTNAGLKAGEALDVAAPCYIKSSDGLVYMSNGTAANEAAEVIGFTPKAYDSGKPVTLVGVGAIFHYAESFSADSVSPGDRLFVGATKGRLDKAATTGDAVGVATVLDNQHIVVSRAFGEK